MEGREGRGGEGKISSGIEQENVGTTYIWDDVLYRQQLIILVELD